jgi:glutamate synthase (NADPH/NADH) large chain
MTGGKVVILGSTGRNFAAGMSGGVAYVYNPDGTFEENLNAEMVDLDALDSEDVEFLRDMIVAHVDATDSAVGQRVLNDWDGQLKHFIKVMPRDFKRVLEAKAEAERTGSDVDEAIMAAANA